MKPTTNNILYVLAIDDFATDRNRLVLTDSKLILHKREHGTLSINFDVYTFECKHFLGTVFLLKENVTRTFAFVERKHLFKKSVKKIKKHKCYKHIQQWHTN